MNKLRVVYGKSKDAVYISQEDTIKIFNESFEKTSIPVIKSQETKLVEIMFAHPLTDGYESTGEIFDIFLTEEVEARYFIREINRILPAGFMIFSAEYVSSMDDSINLKVYGAEYIISIDYTEKFRDRTLKEKEEIKSFYRKKMELYLSQAQILVVKKSYDRMERLDIKHQIESYSFHIDNSVDITMSAGPRSNISPSMIMDGYMEYINDVIEYNVKRTKILYN